MGFTYVKIKVFSPVDPSRFEEVELLVDSGALHMSIPKEMLEALGIKPVRRGRYRTFEGKEVERAVGEALIELMGERRHVPVIFAEEGDAAVLGVITLEVFELNVNPLTGELERAPYPLI
ncbi:MAG: aspartyl protease family protein [Thermofilaceae archaeon]